MPPLLGQVENIGYDKRDVGGAGRGLQKIGQAVGQLGQSLDRADALETQKSNQFYKQMATASYNQFAQAHEEAASQDPSLYGKEKSQESFNSFFDSYEANTDDEREILQVLKAQSNPRFTGVNYSKNEDFVVKGKMLKLDQYQGMQFDLAQKQGWDFATAEQYQNDIHTAYDNVFPNNPMGPSGARDSLQGIAQQRLVALSNPQTQDQQDEKDSWTKMADADTLLSVEKVLGRAGATIRTTNYELANNLHSSVKAGKPPTWDQIETIQFALAHQDDPNYKLTDQQIFNLTSPAPGAPRDLQRAISLRQSEDTAIVSFDNASLNYVATARKGYSEDGHKLHLSSFLTDYSQGAGNEEMKAVYKKVHDNVVQGLANTSPYTIISTKDEYLKSREAELRVAEENLATVMGPDSTSSDFQKQLALDTIGSIQNDISNYTRNTYGFSAKTAQDKQDMVTGIEGGLGPKENYAQLLEYGDDSADANKIINELPYKPETKILSMMAYIAEPDSTMAIDMVGLAMLAEKGALATTHSESMARGKTLVGWNNNVARLAGSIFPGRISPLEKADVELIVGSIMALSSDDITDYRKKQIDAGVKIGDINDALKGPAGAAIFRNTFSKFYDTVTIGGRKVSVPKHPRQTFIKDGTAQVPFAGRSPDQLKRSQLGADQFKYAFSDIMLPSTAEATEWKRIRGILPSQQSDSDKETYQKLVDKYKGLPSYSDTMPSWFDARLTVDQEQLLGEIEERFTMAPDASGRLTFGNSHYGEGFTEILQSGKPIRTNLNGLASWFDIANKELAGRTFGSSNNEDLMSAVGFPDLGTPAQVKEVESLVDFKDHYIDSRYKDKNREEFNKNYMAMWKKLPANGKTAFNGSKIMYDRQMSDMSENIELRTFTDSGMTVNINKSLEDKSNTYLGNTGNYIGMYDKRTNAQIGFISTVEGSAVKDALELKGENYKRYGNPFFPMGGGFPDDLNGVSQFDRGHMFASFMGFLSTIRDGKGAATGRGLKDDTPEYDQFLIDYVNQNAEGAVSGTFGGMNISGEDKNWNRITKRNYEYGVLALFSQFGLDGVIMQGHIPSNEDSTIGSNRVSAHHFFHVQAEIDGKLVPISAYTANQFNKYSSDNEYFQMTDEQLATGDTTMHEDQQQGLSATNSAIRPLIGMAPTELFSLTKKNPHLSDGPPPSLVDIPKKKFQSLSSRKQVHVMTQAVSNVLEAGGKITKDSPNLEAEVKSGSLTPFDAVDLINLNPELGNEFSEEMLAEIKKVTKATSTEAEDKKAEGERLVAADQEKRRPSKKKSSPTTQSGGSVTNARGLQR